MAKLLTNIIESEIVRFHEERNEETGDMEVVNRVVKQYWNPDGTFLAEADPLVCICRLQYLEEIIEDLIEELEDDDDEECCGDCDCNQDDVTHCQGVCSDCHCECEANEEEEYTEPLPWEDQDEDDEIYHYGFKESVPDPNPTLDSEVKEQPTPKPELTDDQEKELKEFTELMGHLNDLLKFMK